MGALTGCAPKEEQLAQIPDTPSPAPVTKRDDAPIAIAPQSSQLEPSNELPKAPKIEVSVGKEPSLKDFGLTNYPNLIKSTGNPQSSSKTTDAGTEITLTVFSKDSPQKVADFYADQITSNKSKSITSTTAVVGGVTKTGAKVFIVASKISGKTNISISATLSK